MSNIFISNNKVKNMKYIILSILLYGLLFENIFERYIPILGKVDEIVGVLIILLGLFSIIRGKGISVVYKNSYKILLSMTIFVVIGLVGNFIFRYQYTYFALKDIFTFRGLFAYAMLPIVFDDFKLEDYITIINKNLRFITVVLFTMTIFNLILDVFPYYEIRFGIKSQQIIFTHPTYLAATSIMVICMLSAFIKEERKNYIYIFMMYIVVLLTLRTKAIIFLLGHVYLFIIVSVKKRKLNKFDFIIIGIVAIGFSINQVSEYLRNPEWARSAMLINSFDIAKSSFPFGSGFGTFGSWVSGVNYSPLYFNYDMYTTWGLAPDYYNFVSDNFWPMVIAQCGFIGLALIIYTIYIVYKDIRNNDNLYMYFGQMSVLIYLLSASIGEASFAGQYSVIAFIIIGLLNKYNRRTI